MTIFIYSLITFSTFTVARVLLYLSYFAKEKPMSPNAVGWAFWRGLRFDAAIFMAYFGILILLAFLPFQWVYTTSFQYTIYTLWLLFFLFAFGALVGDLIYFKYVDRHMTNEFRFLVTETASLFKTFTTNYKVAALVTGACIFGFVCLWFIIPAWHFVADGFPGYTLALIRFVLIVPLVAYLLHGNGLKGKPIATINAHHNATRDQATLIMNGLFSATHYLYNSRKRKSKEILNPDLAIQTVLSIVHPEKSNEKTEYPLYLPPAASTPHALPAKPNIAVIVVEGFNAHNIPSIFKKTPSPWADHNIMPFLSEMSKRSWLCTNFFSNGQRTIDMVHTLLTSMPRLGGVPLIGYDNDFSTVNYEYLPQLAQKNGYTTTVFNGPWANSIHMNSIASLTGFQNYFAGEDINEKYLKESGLPPSEVGAWDEHLFEFAYQDLKKATSPTLSLIFTATSHSPNEVPHKKQEQFGTSGEKKKYFNTNRYLDTVLEGFFKKVDTNPAFDNTIFYIVGDHLLFPLPGEWSPTGLFHTPLLMYNKKHITPKVDPRITSHMDIFPTILEMIGNTAPHVNFGQSILNEHRHPFTIMSQGDIIHATDGKNWIVFPDIELPPETYTLHNNYFLKATQESMDKLITHTKSYYQATNTLFQKNIFFPVR